MEIDITHFFHTAAPMDYSASVAEIGASAGADTWRAACEDAADYPELLDTEDKRQAFRDYVRGFGAWDDSEIAAWSDSDLTALLMQFIAGDMREGNIGPDVDNWAEYERSAEQGTIAGRLYRGDNGRIYFYIGK